MDISREELTTKLIDKYGYTKQLLDSLNEDDFYEWVERLRDDTIYSIEGIPLDQQAKADAGKVDPTLVPVQAILDIAEVREYGNRKYPEGGRDNWRQVSVERYRAALFRHLLAYLRNPKGKDEESGIEHYKHLICNAAFICELEDKA